MEQLVPLLVFLGYQLFAAIDLLASQKGISRGSHEYILLRNQIVAVVGGVGFLLISILIQMGHFGAVSARVRGLFLKHTRTGNPLVDSVAEHQPTTNVRLQQAKYICFQLDSVGFLGNGWPTCVCPIFL